MCVEENARVYSWARGAHPTGLKQIQRRHPRMTLSGIQNVDGLKTGFPIRSASGMTGIEVTAKQNVDAGVGYNEKIMWGAHAVYIRSNEMTFEKWGNFFVR
ncbi:hypothetical protein NSMM_400174 [Nitrosomonas mobilis]|uniref:Uncharacterized protein n=2 Tax=Nitrosomonas mobilis TaxID=51642 RepID=A0A1G5SER1_9PROT|nr:hypothetical protein NSMM_400174 [Nitrosomonas mobilis]